MSNTTKQRFLLVTFASMFIYEQAYELLRANNIGNDSDQLESFEGEYEEYTQVPKMYFLVGTAWNEAQIRTIIREQLKGFSFDFSTYYQ